MPIVDSGCSFTYYWRSYVEITNLADAKLELMVQFESIVLLDKKLREIERWQWHRRLWLAIKRLVARIHG